MEWLRTREGAEALDRLGAGLQLVGTSLREIAGLAQSDYVAPGAAASGNPQQRGVGLLMRRLGSKNQNFLWQVAQDYQPGEAFSLEDMAGAAGISKDSARARLMNIGRSLKSLGPDAPTLWEVEWGDGGNSYEWNYDA